MKNNSFEFTKAIDQTRVRISLVAERKNHCRHTNVNCHRTCPNRNWLKRQNVCWHKLNALNARPTRRILLNIWLTVSFVATLNGSRSNGIQWRRHHSIFFLSIFFFFFIISFCFDCFPFFVQIENSIHCRIERKSQNYWIAAQVTQHTRNQSVRRYSICSASTAIQILIRPTIDLSDIHRQQIERLRWQSISEHESRSDEVRVTLAINEIQTQTVAPIHASPTNFEAKVWHWIESEIKHFRRTMTSKWPSQKRKHN